MPTAIPATQSETQSSLPKRKYPNPPVIEAVVDIQIASREAPDLGAIARVMQENRDEYPKQDTLVTASVTVDPSASMATQASQQVIGFRYATAASDAITQMRVNGFGFSRLAPYPKDGWEEWAPRAKALWGKYAASVQPHAVTRLGVRYINRILVPVGEDGETARPEEFFLTRPEIAASLSPVRDFFMRLELIQPGIEDGGLTITQAVMAEPRAPHAVPILLDLDVHRRVSLNPHDDAVWAILEELHERETDAFEACITDQTRRLFE